MFSQFTQAQSVQYVRLWILLTSEQCWGVWYIYMYLINGEMHMHGVCEYLFQRVLTFGCSHMHHALRLSPLSKHAGPLTHILFWRNSITPAYISCRWAVAGGSWAAFDRVPPWTVVPGIRPLEMHMRKVAYGRLQTTLKLWIYPMFPDE